MNPPSRDIVAGRSALYIQSSLYIASFHWAITWLARLILIGRFAIACTLHCFYIPYITMTCSFVSSSVLCALSRRSVGSVLLSYVVCGTTGPSANMVKILEIRIVMPLTLEEYRIGHRYSVASMSKDETGGGEGVQVLKDEHFQNVPLFGGRFTSGQYTRKVYRFASKVPWWVRKVAPAATLTAVEEAWDAFPYCKKVALSQNDDYVVTIESMHLPDRGTTENALELPPDQLSKRKVQFIDIAGKVLNAKDYKEKYDPCHFKSTETKRGPLKPGWMAKYEPIMCCYKVIHVQVNGWTLLKTRIENFLCAEYPRLYQRLHRKIFCTIDDWHDMTMEEVMEMENETKEVLEKQRLSKETRGSAPADE